MSDHDAVIRAHALRRRLELHLQAENLGAILALDLEDSAVGQAGYGSWALSRFGVALPDERIAGLPDGMRMPLEGWNAYRQGRTALAESRLIASWSMETVDAAWVALGLAKVYTHAAFWTLARDWCLVALARARAEDDIVLVSHAYGALGEILLRADQPRASFEAFELSFKLAQPGAGAVERRLNCLAGSLSRCGEDVAVETLLMSALHLASGRDPVSLRYSLARLQFHWLATGRDLLVEEELPEFAAEPCRAFEPEAYLAMGRAFAEVRLGRSEKALRSARSAELGFLPAMPLEGYWARRLQSVLSGENCEGLPEDWHGCVGHPVRVPDSPFDRVWQEPALENESLAVIAAARSLGDVFELRRIFFV